MLKPGDIAIVSGARTPFGRYCGKLKDFTAQELGAIAAKGPSSAPELRSKEFDHAVFGNAQQTSGDALLRRAPRGLARGPADRNSGADGESPVRIGHAGDRERGADDPARRSEDGAGRRHGSDVAGAVCRFAGATVLRWRPGGKLEDSLMVALLDSYCGLYMANTAELYGRSRHHAPDAG